jgi:hypothetical protein
MTKAQRRQRAYYRERMKAWQRGEWVPPPHWAQMVADRFPDLLEEFRERALGSQKAEEVRTAHAEALKPKVGELVTIPGTGTCVITEVDLETHRLTIARATKWNRFIVWLRLWWAALVAKFKGGQAHAA